MFDTPYIDIHTHHTNRTDSVVSIVNYFLEQFDPESQANEFISVGLHPWHINDISKSEIHPVLSAATQENLLAIGEIGLDRTLLTPLNIQEEFFIEQISIAENLHKPLIIHCVKSFSELLQIKKRIKSSTPWLIHGFRNKIQIAEQLLKQNCFISFGEALLFDKQTQDVFIQMPLERIFLETDESAYTIREIYNKAAHLRAMELNQFKQKLFDNYRMVFHTQK